MFSSSKIPGSISDEKFVAGSHRGKLRENTSLLTKVGLITLDECRFEEFSFFLHYILGHLRSIFVPAMRHLLIYIFFAQNSTAVGYPGGREGRID